MSLPILIASFGMILFGTLAIYFTIQERKLKKLLSEKEDTTHAVVHELRAPLTAIKTAAEMIVQSKALNESQHKLAIIIDEQSKRLLTDINSFLDAAKMNAGHFTISQAPSDIAPLITQTVQLFMAEAEKKEINLKSTLEETLPQVAIDAPRIAQVLNNLLSNSLKSTPAGGDITVAAAQSKQPDQTSTIVISVTDTGEGMSEDQQKLLFTKFAPVHGKEAPQQTGNTGLGLYIAKEIVKAHGGTMSVHSNPHHGTTVSFTLPIAKGEEKTTDK